jgi:hypothetical protein
MTIVSYHSTLVGQFASSQEAIDKTSSEILFSRDVAGPDGETAPSPSGEGDAPSAMPVFESNSRHVMTLSEPAHTASSVSQITPKSNVSEEPSKLPKITFWLPDSNLSKAAT